ncbi:MAG: sulfite exporter TauE/SafE family protein [Desulfarculus sp.]|nr:sulfite exporter TauE/SafE family protein [Pseudomonadota bacterium]MBV1717592.1 sulfite exporter TauE/SafE family protein [Desulfarculus sp.]MBU4574100.1 sulfite exporter TauE/SafE family protein [Pseudomonadota bacterium]MBU4598201.1 sulfite exporter TauE/SafE family protein [Pseudomonadota bacterium]MBV1737901.1 sulfite exporter TauE/SafE family protein [Desulfarculus sp.]
MRKLWLATLSIMILGLMTAVATTGSLAQKTAVAPAGQEQASIVSKDMPAKLQAAIKKSLADPKFADKTKKAVAAGVAKRGPEPGFLGIPGAPAAHYVWGLLWAVWVGWIFSTVGAFGGIMAGVGHITIFGLGDYASSYGKGNPVNKLVTDSIRVSNQWLVGLSALISSFNYYKMGRLVLPLGACLAVGGVAGSWLIPELTAGKVSLKAYIGYFGLLVFVLACFLIYEMTPKGQASKKAAKAAAAAFENSTKEGDTSDKGVKIVEGKQGLMWLALACVVASGLWFNLVGSTMVVAYVLALAGMVLTFFMGTIRFTFFGVEFKFRAFIPMLGGLVIAAIASFLGVGGGFLFVPFLTSVAGLPMFLVAGTSALAVLVGMIVSIFSYMVGKGVVVSWGLIGAELIGIFIGSMIGPRTSKYIPEKWLKIIFIILAFYVGLRYTTKGFLGYSIVPPF